MSRKSKGMNVERELIHLFWGDNWAAVRVAGSGSMKYPCPDILAGNSSRKLAIECKATKSKYQYLSKDEIHQLKSFAVLFGAEPWIGLRFNNEDWRFMELNALKETTKNFTASLETAKKYGKSFSQLLSL